MGNAITNYKRQQRKKRKRFMNNLLAEQYKNLPNIENIFEEYQKRRKEFER